MDYKELKTKSEAEIRQLLIELRGKAHELSVKMKMNQVKNNSEIKTVKKDIARIMTFLHNKTN